MSSNIRLQRICDFCGKEFEAKTTVTRCCSHKCSSGAYKERKRQEKKNTSNVETSKIINRPIEALKAKEFLTVRDASKLLGCSIRTTYRLIDNGSIDAVNLGERLTRIKRSALDKVLS